MEIEKHIHIKIGEISGTMTWEQAKEYAVLVTDVD